RALRPHAPPRRPQAQPPGELLEHPPERVQGPGGAAVGEVGSGPHGHQQVGGLLRLPWRGGGVPPPAPAPPRSPCAPRPPTGPGVWGGGGPPRRGAPPPADTTSASIPGSSSRVSAP